MGWNGSGQKGAAPVQPKVTPRKPSPVRGIVAGGLVCVLAAGAYFVFFSGPEKPQAEKSAKKPTRIQEVTPAPAPKAAEKPEKAPEPKKPSNREAILKMTPEERHELAVERIRQRGLDLTPTTNRPFRTGTELQMARIFMTELGDAPPPFFPMPLEDEVHLADILIANNPAIEGDSEKVKQAKEMVELAKKEMRAYIKEGGDPHNFLSYYQGKLWSAFEERNMAAKEMMRVAREEPDIAADFCAAANKKLEEKGIKPFELPQKIKQKIGME